MFCLFQICRHCQWNISFSPTFSKTPSIRSRVLSKTETFFSEYDYRPHITGLFGHQKRRFSNTLSRVESFENGDSSHSCGWAKTETSKYDDVLPRFRSSAHSIRKRCVWMQIFLNTEKKFQFLKIPGDVWTLKYDSRTLRVDTGLCLNAEKKISVFENTRLRVDEA